MIKKKKLAIFIYSLGKGGAEKVVSTLLFCLQDKFEVSLVLLKNEVVYDIPNGIPVDIININPLSYKKYCKKNKIDISLSLLTKPNFISIVSKILGNKSVIIVSEHTNTILWYSKVMLKLISIFYKRADKVITVSKKIAFNLDKYLGIKNTKVIYNPYTISTIINQEEINDNIDFITVGTLYDVKNHKLLIESFANISDKSKNLYILGDGPLKSDLEILIKELKLENRVFLLGFQSNPYKYMKKAKVFVLSSNNEGLPNVLIEALALNCAIISTDCVSGPREIIAPDTDFNYQNKDKIEYAQFGLLVPIKNQDLLVKAMNDINVEHYNSKSLQRAYDFDCEKQCIKYYKELESI